MSRAAIFYLLLGLACGSSPAQSTPTAGTTPKVTFDYESPAEAQVLQLHQAWQAEHDPAKRRDLAGQLVEAVIHEYGSPQTDIVDEVARDGALKNELHSAAPVCSVLLQPLEVLAGVHANGDAYPKSPVFRRMTANRFEAWTSKEGWLFDGKGKLRADVKVPRRDGNGREWFGAFLPDGRWITTDLWANDEQLNCFSPSGEWKWELPGKKILSQLAKPKMSLDSSNEPTVPSIGWARADKTGHRWLVCLGFDYTRQYTLIDSTGRIRRVDDQDSPWSEVYPRAMGARGMYTSLYIESDDGKMSVHRNEAGHGVEVGWPRYDWVNMDTVVIQGGDDEFGFWPHSHDVYIEGQQSVPEPWHLPHLVWFFSAGGKYQGEVVGSRLGDAANGHDLLIQDADDQVVQVASDKDGLAIQDVRRFAWADGTTAVPLAIYDDLHLGFFLGGLGMQGFTDEARRARAGADVVLATW